MPTLKKRREAHLKNYAFKLTRNEQNLNKIRKRTRKNRPPLMKLYRSKCKAYTNGVYNKCGAIWNQLDVETRNIEDLKKFKFETKKMLYSELI